MLRNISFSSGKYIFWKIPIFLHGWENSYDTWQLLGAHVPFCCQRNILETDTILVAGQEISALKYFGWYKVCRSHQAAPNRVDQKSTKKFKKIPKSTQIRFGWVTSKLHIINVESFYSSNCATCYCWGTPFFGVFFILIIWRELDV